MGKDSSSNDSADFATILAFFEKFGEQCGIVERPDSKKLQQMLENSDDVCPELIDLHVKLLRKIRKIVHLDKWERALAKFCYTYSNQDAWEIERFGYKKSSLSVKLRVLKALCETQFDLNTKFKTAINLISAADLRSEPIGHDKQGNAYWCFIDEKCNLKVYQENADDETWQIVANSREEMAQLIQKLKGNVPIKPLLDDLVDEDTSSMPPKLETPVKTEEVDSKAEGPVPAKPDHSDDEYKEVDEDPSDIEESPGKNPKIVSPKPQEALEASKPKTEVQKATPKLLLKPPKPVEEYSDEEIEEEESDISGDDEVPPQKPAEASAITPTKTKITLKPPAKPQEEYSDEEDEYSDEESEYTDEDDGVAQPTPSKRPQIIIKPGRLNASPQKVSAEAKPTIVAKKAPPATTQNDDTADSEADYDDLEEEEIEEEESDNSEVGEAIVEPVMRVKGAGSGKDNKCGNFGLEFGEVIEEEVFFVFGEGSGRENDVGNPSKSGEETENGEKSAIPSKPMFFFGQPGCLKNSPVKSSPTLSPMFGACGESSVLNFSEKIRESLSTKLEEKALSTEEAKPIPEIDESMSQSTSESEKLAPEPKPTDHTVNEVPLTNTTVVEDDKPNGKQAPSTENEPTITGKVDETIEQPNTSPTQPTSPCLNDEANPEEKEAVVNELPDKPLPCVEEPLKVDDIPKTDIQEDIRTNDKELCREQPEVPNEPKMLEERKPESENTEGEDLTVAKVSETPADPIPKVPETTVEPKTPESRTPDKVPAEPTSSRAQKSLNLNEIARNLATTAEEKEQAHQDIFGGASKFHKIGKVRAKIDVPPRADALPSPVEPEKKIELSPPATEKRPEEVTPTKPATAPEKVEKSPEFSKSKPFKAQILEKFSSSNEQGAAAVAVQTKKDKDLTPPKSTASPPVSHSVSQMLNATKPRKAQILEKFSYEMKSKEEQSRNTVDAQPADLSQPKEEATDLSKKPTPEKAPDYPTKYPTAGSVTFRPSDHSILSLTGGASEVPRAAPMGDKTTASSFNSLEQLSNLVSVYKKINTNRQGMSKTTEIIQKVDYGPVEAAQPQEKPNSPSVIPSHPQQLEVNSLPSAPEVQSVRLEPSKAAPEQIVKLLKVDEPEIPAVLETKIEENTKKQDIVEEFKPAPPPKVEEREEKVELQPLEPVKKEEVAEKGKEETASPVEPVNKLPESAEKRKGRYKSVDKAKTENKTPEKVEVAESSQVKAPEKRQETPEELKPVAVDKETTPENPRETKPVVASRKRGAAKMSEKVVEADDKEATEQPGSDSDSGKEAGGKRAKLRQKRQSPPNKQLRKTVEQRKNEERSTSSDEEVTKSTEPPKKGGRLKKATPPTARNQRPGKTEAAASSKASTESPNEFIGFDEDEIATSTINRKQIEEEKERKEKEAAAKVTPKGRQAKKTPVKEDPLKVDTSKVGGDEEAKEEEADKKPKKFKHLIRQLDTSLVIQTQDNEAPVRTSRRIAQLKIREEADRRKMEEQLLKQMKAECVKKKRQAGADDDTQNDDAGEDKSSDFKPSDDEDSKDTEKQKRKKKSKKDNPWQTDSDDDAEKSAAEEEEREREDPEDYRLPELKSDHEFSPESDLEDAVAVPTKRARTVKKEPKVDAESSEEEFSAEHTCQKCGKTDHPEWILLCDSCDHGWHCSCLTPVLFVIPEGDWFCPLCQHKKLIDNLEAQLIEYDKRLHHMELEEARKKRLELEEIEKLEKAAQEKEKHEKEKEQRKKEKRDSGAKRSRRRMSSSGTGSESGSGSESDSESDATSKKRKKMVKPKSPVKAKTDKKAVTESEGSESESARSQSSGTNSSDDEPIYKLRRRNQNNVSYRFNAYDELINLAIKKDEMEVDDDDAIVASVFGDANAGNEGRGKDISTIMEADKEEKKVVAAQPRVGKGKQMGESDDEDEEPEKDEEVHKSGGKHMTSSDSDEPIAAVMKKVKKKKKRLNCLDINSDESDASDESFKGGTPDSEDEETELSNASESSLELMHRKRSSKSAKRKMRASTRKREKRYDQDFIDDDSSDNSKSRRRGKKKSRGGRKKEYDPLDDENDEDDDDESLDSEEVDSEDLCDDTTESSGSEMGWRKKKKKKGNNRSGGGGKGGGKGGGTASSGGGKQLPTTPKAAAANVKRKVKRVEENDKSFRAGVSTKKLKKPAMSESDSDDQPIRRTRGRQMHYTEEDYFESSDDGIKPGVKRPDTPPEEREKFIKRQEEIKRMLAEKNMEAAKQLAAPKIDGVKTPTKTGAAPMPSDSLSTVPLQVIEGAKELDPEFLKPSKNNSISELSGAFDNLPEDFNPEDMDEEELAKMMEEEDFAQHQLKLAGEAIARKKKEGMSLTMVLDEKEIIKDMPDDINKPPKLTKAGAEVKKRGRKIKTELDVPLTAPKIGEGLQATLPPVIPVTKAPMVHGPPPVPHHYPPNLHPAPPGSGHVPHSFLSQQLQQHLKPHPMPGHHPGHPPAHMSMPPHQQRHPMMMASHYRHPLAPVRHPHHQQVHPGGSGLPQPPYLIHQPNRHMGPFGPPPPTSHHLPYNTNSSGPPPSSTATTSQPQMPSQKPPPMPPAPVPTAASSVSSLEAMIPTTVLSVSQQTALAPTPNTTTSQVSGGDIGAADKKRGRRKKITPLRDDLPQADPAQSLLQMKPEFAEKMGLKPPGGPTAPPTVVPHETNSASGSATTNSKLAVAPPPQLFNPSTIGSGSVITRLLQPQRPSMFRGSNDPQPRYLAPPPSKPPSSSHLPPDHYLGPQPPHPMYRGPTPPSSIFGSPSARMPGVPPGYHPSGSGPPPLGKPIRGSLPPPQEYQNPYPPQYAGYYPPPPTQPQQLTVATHVPTQHPQISPNPHRQSYSPQNPQHTPFESVKATVVASPQHTPSSPAAPLEEHPPSEEPASSSEFSGLVSYFSSQHDDLDT